MQRRFDELKEDSFDDEETDEPRQTHPDDSQLKTEIERAVTGFDWDFQGIKRGDGSTMDIPPESKVVTIVFEFWAQEQIQTMIDENGWDIRMEIGGSRQYPDVTLFDNEFSDGKQYALDIKTGRKNESGTELDGYMTLGSYSGYFRNPSANPRSIPYPYATYDEHLIATFLHQWDENAGNEGMVSDIEIVFVEKWKISGFKPGSGDTNNIGSVKEINRLKNGDGDFETRSRFDEYYSSLPLYEDRSKGEVDEFIAAWKAYLDSESSDMVEFYDEWKKDDTVQQELD